MILTEQDEIIEVLNDYADFGPERAYIMMAIARNKENEQLNANDEIVFREVVKHQEDIERKYEKLKTSAQHYTPDEGGDLTFRLYMSVNARNVMKAYWNFRSTLDKWMRDLHNGDPNAQEKFKKVDHYWKSQVHSDSVKDDNYFLFDVDDENLINDFLNHVEEKTRVVRTFKSPNGYNVVTEPFNYTNFSMLEEEEELEMDTDDMFFVTYLSR